MKRMQRSYGMPGQRGFTLMELMISLALGLLISAAAVQLFLANQITMNFQRGMNDVQANGRFAIDQMVQDIRLAGLGPANLSAAVQTKVAPIVFASTDVASAVPVTVFTANDQGTVGDVGKPEVAGAGALSPSDQLVVQHFMLVDGVDCEGNTALAGTYVISRYFVRPDDANNDIPSLACDGAILDGSNLTGYNDAGVVLVNGVDSFQIIYGLDDGANNSPQVARYVNLADYAAMGVKPPILAVRIALYMQSAERAGDAAKPAADVNVLDSTIKTADIPDDNLLRRLFTTTVTMRNAMVSGV